MKNQLIFLVTLMIGTASCNKKEIDETPKDYSKTVTFDYNNTATTFNVIKVDYYKNAQGQTLSQPITKLWLDRNLGAQRVATSMNDSLAAGDLFQWGRLADGHQSKQSDTTRVLSTSITPGHSKFIAVPLGSNDWLSVPDSALWNTASNTNCSCPDGWRVPTIEELTLEMNSWSTKNLDGAFASPLNWTSSGDRDNHGVVRYINDWSFIWSSTPAMGSYSKNLAIIGSSTAEISTSPRIFGLSVRCIKDY